VFGSGGGAGGGGAAIEDCGGAGTSTALRPDIQCIRPTAAPCRC